MKRNLICILLLPIIGEAAPAQLDSIWPPGGKRGAEIEFTLKGKFEPWPCELHFSEKGFTFVPDKEKSGTGKLKIGSKVPVGPVIVRALNPGGASAPHIFLVDEQLEILEEDEDDNRVSKAQQLDSEKLPLVVNGQLPGNHELDSFRLSLKKGESVYAAVEGYAIRSLIDPVLQVYDKDGNRLVMQHDGAVNLDPTLHFTASESGDFTIVVTAFAHPPASSVYFRGGKKAQYRLHLGNKREQLPKRVFPDDPGPDSKSGQLDLKNAVVGTLTKPNEVDNFTITAKKGESYWIQVQAARLGFPTDPVLRILKPDGSELKLIDDSNKESDPEYLWKVAVDGDYQVSVTDRFRRGGASYRYQISIEEPKPDFSATIEKSEYLLEPGKSVDLKVKITRNHGHKENLIFEIPGLPAGVTLKSPDKIPEKGGDVVLTLAAGKDAAPFQKPLGIRVFDEDQDGKKTGEAKNASFSFRDDTYRGPYVIMELPSVWLSIPPPKKEEPKKEEEKK